MDPTIEELTTAVEREARKRPDVIRLMTHPGVGPLTALAFCWEELASDFPFELFILQVHLAHAIAPWLFDDVVVRDGLPDHRLGFRHNAVILGCNRERVNEGTKRVLMESSPKLWSLALRSNRLSPLLRCCYPASRILHLEAP